MNGNRISKILAYTAIILGFFMAQLDTTIVNITIPRITAYFHTDANITSWVINGYNLAFAVFLITASRLADQFGRKRLFIIGVTLFTLASLMCALSTNVSWLIFFRVLQGLAAAAIVPVTMPMALALASKEHRGTVIGLWGAFAAFSAACGPAIGGGLAQKFQWHSIFIVNIPIGIICLILTAIYISETKDNTASKQIDWGGMLTLSIGTFALTFALVQANEKGWLSIYILSLFTVAVLAYILFFVIEKKVKEPMLPLWLLKIWPFTAGNITLFMLGVGMMSGVFLLAFYLIDIMGYSSLRAGLTNSILPLTGMLFSIFMGPLAQKHGSRWFGVLGIFLLSLSAFLFSLITPQSSAITVIIGLIIAGAGMGTTMSTVMGATVRALPLNKVGIGSGVTNMARTLGTVFGIAVLLTILGGYTQTQMQAFHKQSETIINQHSELDLQTRKVLVESLNELSGSVQAAESGKEAVIVKMRQGAQVSNDNQLKKDINSVEAIYAELRNRAISGRSIAYNKAFRACGAIVLIGILFAFFCEPKRKKIIDLQFTKERAEKYEN
jgi:drug resistance transporter, EmrB/QacA subfamily